MKTAALLAAWAFGPVALIVGAYTIRAGISLLRDHLAANRTADAFLADLESRDVNQRTVHIAPDWLDMWAELDYWNSEDAR